MKFTLNADLGESWYDQKIGDDAALMPHLDLCNIACGFHGGDTLTMYRIIELAMHHGVSIGAHPSFPDRKNFGRRVMAVDDRLFSLLLYQVGALNTMAGVVTGEGLYHLKPHGALYHYADANTEVASIIVKVMVELGIPHLIGPPGGVLQVAAEAAGRTFLAEGFVDRVYEPSLHLRSRQLPGACIENLSTVIEQAKMLATKGCVRTSDGEIKEIDVNTLCVHGDHSGAAQRARAVREMLDAIPTR